MTAVWTNESIAELRRMLAENMTFTEIGVALNLSKSAIAGKASRLGISTGRRMGKAEASARHTSGKQYRDGWSDGVRASIAPITLPKLKWMDGG